MKMGDSLVVTLLIFVFSFYFFGIVETKDKDIFTNEPEETGDKKMKFGDIVIPDYYNKLEIPSYNYSILASKGISDELYKKFHINVGVSVRGVGNVDELEEEITVEMDFTAMWLDTVLFAENMHLFNKSEPTDEELMESLRSMDPAFLSNIWKPDLFIENVVSIERPWIILKPIKLLFSPIGIIIFSTRITVTMDCEMEFHYYPADTQRCDFRIRSYSHTINQLELLWKDPGAYILDRNEHNFDIKISDVIKINITEAEGLIFPLYNETYDVLQFTISARRSLSYHMIQTYLPSMFFIVITWLCFLIPVALVEARIGVAMTTLLTLTSMFSSVRESTPIVSYIKAIDVWMVTCIFFVFSTLLEFTILVFMRHGGVCEQEEDVIDTFTTGSVKANEHLPEDMAGKEKKRPEDVNEFEDGFFIRLRKMRKRRSGALRGKLTGAELAETIRERKRKALWIEEYALLLFFLTFLAFNLIYWPWLFIASGYFNWHVEPKYNAMEL